MKKNKMQVKAVIAAVLLSAASIAGPVAAGAEEMSETENFVSGGGISNTETEPPVIRLPQDLKAVPGQELREIPLSEGWSWADESTVVAGDVKEYPARYLVDDTVLDYSAVEGYDAQGHYVERSLPVEVKAEETAEETSEETGVSVASETAPRVTGGVALNGTNFPDGVFLTYLKDGFDKDKDDVLSEAESKNLQVSVRDRKDITDLTGIEKIPSLYSLDCNGSGVADLPDIGPCTNLTVLDCGNTGGTAVWLMRRRRRGESDTF